MNADKVNTKIQINNKQSNCCVVNLKEILYQSKQSIDVNMQFHPTGTLATTLLNPPGEENPYVQFLYGPQKIFNHTQGQLSVSMNYDPINRNKKSQL